MNIRKLTFALFCSPFVLAGCGGSVDSPALANFSPAQANFSPSPDFLFRVDVPSGGGTVVLPNTPGLAGKLVFAPGAPPGTQLFLNVSETRPPNAPGTDVTSGPVQSKGFYFLTLASNQPLDMSLITSLQLTEQNNDKIAPRVDADPVPDVAEQYRCQLNDVTPGGTRFLHEIPGSANPNRTEATFTQVPPILLQPGRSFMLQAMATDVETLPTTIVNNSGVEPAYACILGRNPNPLNGGVDPTNYRVSADGQLVPLQKSDRNIDVQSNNNGGFNGYTDLYNIPIPAGGLKLNLPQMAAGRVYVSLGNKLKVRLEDRVAPPEPPIPPGNVPLSGLATPLNLAQPNGWGNPGDPNYRVLWDWAEFDYKVNIDTKKPGMGINKTEVDMMGFGMQIRMQGPTIGDKTIGTKVDGRQKIFDALQADPTFRSLIIAGPAKGERPDGTAFDLPADIPVRALAPKKAIDNVLQNIAPGQVPTFDTTFFDQYLTDVWNKYKVDELKCFTSAFGTYSGRVDAQERLVFTRVTDAGVPIPGFDKIYLRKPTTADAFEPTAWITTGGITFEPTPGNQVPVPPPPAGVAAPKDGDDPKLFTPYAASEIVSAMSAAMNRTTLLLETFVTRDYRLHPATLANFYANLPRFNLYAKAIHDHSLTTTDAPGPPTSNGGGAAYAFGFDDNSNQSSFISENTSPTNLVITVTPLKP